MERGEFRLDSHQFLEESQLALAFVEHIRPPIEKGSGRIKGLSRSEIDSVDGRLNP
jgi:hypothetical protein